MLNKGDGFIGRANVIAAGWLVLAGVAAVPRSAVCDCVQDAYPNSVAPFNSHAVVFPNWTMLPASSFSIYECDDGSCAWCPDGPIVGLTILNYGTATGGAGGDVSGMYFRVLCGKVDSGLLPMTYAGIWSAGEPHPAWTWSGSIPWGVRDPCGECACSVNLDLYCDIAPCPVPGRTLQLGLGFDGTRGGISDQCPCAVPWLETKDTNIKTIRYIFKTVDRDFAAPGDTVRYTVFYGRPGTAVLSGITLTDTLPAYTHYLPGSAIPAPDLGFDPDPGPPVRLRWSLPGGPVTGGATSELTFGITVDWGNGEGFEPGSGNVAAPEGWRLDNRASVLYSGSDCATGFYESEPVGALVRRFLFWLIADNDVLFAGKVGQPRDEVTYSLYIRNMSSKKTWWNVQMWNTVPAELDAWAVNMGFDDPCIGWTMTPSACAAASPGPVTTGTSTIMTWRLDMPPGMTLELRWKAAVDLSVEAGATATSRLSVLELGATGIVEGTGHSRDPRRFVSDSQIILRTTYTTYAAYGYQCAGSTQTSGQAFHMHFFPLNKATDIQLFKQEHSNDEFANYGGVSPTISVMAGTCMGGFPDGGWTGCRAERAPACYWPLAFNNTYPIGGIYPTHILFKAVANAPFVWELLTNAEDTSADRVAFASSASLSFSGRIHYTFLQQPYTGGPPADELAVINTSGDEPTTVFLFRWNALSQSWSFRQMADLAEGAIWRNNTAMLHNESSPTFVWTEQSYRIISSNTNALVWRQIYGSNAQRGFMAPTGESGLLTSGPGETASFYCFPYAQGFTGSGSNISVINIGNVDCRYAMYRYMPLNVTYASNAKGSWKLLASNIVPYGETNPGNPHVYGRDYMAGYIPTSYGNPDPQYFYRIDKITPEASLQVMMGNDLLSSFASGGILHDINGAKSGRDFWLAQTGCANYCVSGGGSGCLGDDIHSIYSLNVYCPASGLTPRLQSFGPEGGYDSDYTTTGPDQVVSFRCLTDIVAPAKRNWRLTVGGTEQDTMVQWIDAQISEKYYTCPFVTQGVYYTIITPAIVYAGTSFWITVAVTVQDGNTKGDYCGISAFSSTDPAAKIEGEDMGAYNYVWSSDSGAGCGSIPFDNGVRMFVNVILDRVGAQTIVATDTLDGSITGLASLIVVAVDIKLTKEDRVTVASSGEIVTFKVCWSNYSSGSAENFVVTDAVPAGTVYVPDPVSSVLCGATEPVNVSMAYSSLASPTMPAAGDFTTLTAGTPPDTARWLRWTVNDIGSRTTGCLCYRVKVN